MSGQRKKSSIEEYFTKEELEYPDLAKLRSETSFFVAKSFLLFGETLEGAIKIESDGQKDEKTPIAQNETEVSGMALLLRISAQMTNSCTWLFQEKQVYAASALLRQIVELEYLAWAFENRKGDAEKWLRSDHEERRKLFTPAKLRDAANGRFRGCDYGYHCELAGHPTPYAEILLKNNYLNRQLLTSDLLGHISGIWDHFVGWGKATLSPNLDPLPS